MDISEVDPAENDICEDAMRLSIPSSVESSIINAGTDRFGESAGRPCGTVDPGVWYLIVGTDNTITASLCNEDTTFDTSLTVFRGNSCSALECLVENDDGGGDACGSKSRASWTALDGVTYYVLVQGFFEVGVGDFRLDVEE